MLLAISMICLCLASAIIGGCIVAAALRKEGGKVPHQSPSIVIEVPSPENRNCVQPQGSDLEEVVDVVTLSASRRNLGLERNRDGSIACISERPLCEDLD